MTTDSLFFLQEKPTIIIRHKRENRKKCSLTPLESDPRFAFHQYPNPTYPSFDGYCVLSFDGPELSPADSHLGLILIDGTWRYAEKMIQIVPDHIPRRSLPKHLVTAYPRRQDDCIEPQRGLASIEALFAAYSILGWDRSGILDSYHWKALFLSLNTLQL